MQPSASSNRLAAGPNFGGNLSDSRLPMSQSGLFPRSMTADSLHSAATLPREAFSQVQPSQTGLFGAPPGMDNASRWTASSTGAAGPASSFDQKPSSSKVTELLQRLIRRVVYAGRSAATSNPAHSPVEAEQLLQYSLRVLASRMYPASERDQFQICEAVKKKCR